MTHTGPPQSAPTPDQIYAVVAAMLDGTGLQIERRRLELIITNPRDPDKGQVCITLDDAYVTWERAVTDYWGHLEGITTRDQDARTVLATKIIQALTGRM
jgi:hypothetical protein